MSDIIMDKLTFISHIKPMLKQLNYQKKGNYWYKAVDEHICCINVQGSQWDKNDYYVDIGFAFITESCNYPTILHWHCRHRCKGASGGRNISPQDLMNSIHNVFDHISSTAEIGDFLKERNAVKVVSQFWF